MGQELLAKVGHVVDWEHFCVLLFLALSSWVFYILALRNLTEDRHRIFQEQFKGLVTWAVLLGLAYGFHVLLLSYRFFFEAASEVSLYTGLMVIALGAALLIKTLKIGAYEYFFFNSMRAGVPLLLVNVFSLILFLFILGWILTYLFGVQLTSVLTTSAVLTIVLGLALQDTLGNLFAAISLQIDKPFEMDDWIELKSGTEKIAGQVKELSWRATVLLAVTDEYITIPNRMLAQWQIVNFSGRLRPFYRGAYFRIPFESSIPTVKSALLKAVKETPEILASPAPLVVITETTESWVMLKVVYALKEYGSQYVVADKFQERALGELRAQNIRLASDRIHIDGLGNYLKKNQTV